MRPRHLGVREVASQREGYAHGERGRKGAAFFSPRLAYLYVTVNFRLQMGQSTKKFKSSRSKNPAALVPRAFLDDEEEQEQELPEQEEEEEEEYGDDDDDDHDNEPPPPRPKSQRIAQ